MNIVGRLRDFRFGGVVVAGAAVLTGGMAEAALLPAGTGADGPLVVSGQVLVDAVRSPLVGDVAAGATSVNVTSAVGLGVGDEVLIITQQGATGAGTYEFARVAGTNGSTVSLASPLANAYAGSSAKVTVQRVPNYTSVTVQSGGTLTAGNWDGTGGGVVAFRASASVAVLDGGAISADALGYRGGTPSPSNSSASGKQGESFTGLGAAGNLAANNGGGGAGLFNTTGGDNGHGGGGGGHATAGTAGQTVVGAAGLGGNTYGTATLAAMFLGSGGGSGGTDDDNPDNAAPYPMAAGGAGGRGGGIVYLEAGSVSVSGTGRISARGQNGLDAVGDPRDGTDPDTGAALNADEPGGGGAGAGGSVFIGYLNDGPASLLAGDVVGGGVGGIGIQANARRGGTGGEGYLIVTSVSAVPEPGTVGVVGAGVVGLLVRRRRRA